MPKLSKSDYQFWVLICRILFIPVLFFELWAIARGNILMEIISKPLLMTILLSVFYFATRAIPSSSKQWIIVALVFSLLGDVFLLFTKDFVNAFTAGLTAFLITQITYMLAFNRAARKYKGHHILFFYPWLVVVLPAYGLLLLWQLFAGLGDMLLPIVIYSIFLLLMVLAALNLGVKRKIWKLPLGAILFLFSDSLLAIGHFTQMLDNYPVQFLVMLLYGSGQYLIIEGMLYVNIILYKN